MVCTLSPAEIVSACADLPMSALKISPKTDARAVAGTDIPTVSKREMRETATVGMFLRFCTRNAGEAPAEVDADFFLEISQLVAFCRRSFGIAKGKSLLLCSHFARQ